MADAADPAVPHGRVDVPVPVDPAVHVTLETLLAVAPLARGAALAEVRRSAAARGGSHASRWRGRGVDFRESRVYQAGDDIRHMDWRVTARSGTPHTKLFEEEREHGLLLMLDFNPGMRFGTRERFKSVQAARAAALLAWMVTAGGDRVGVLGFGGGIRDEVKPAGGRRGCLHSLRALRDWDAEATPATEALSDALERARRLLRPGMRLVLVSDGFSADEAAWPLLGRLAGRHELGCLLVSDAIERAPPPPARYALSLGGSHEVLDFGDRRLREAWAGHFDRARAGVRTAFTRFGARVVELATDGDLRRAIMPFTVRAAGPKDSQA